MNLITLFDKLCFHLSEHVVNPDANLLNHSYLEGIFRLNRICKHHNTKGTFWETFSES